MALKIGDFEVTILKDGKELDKLPSNLPVIDFEGNTVTLDEAQKGYLRQQDYTRKTQEVAQIKELFKSLGVPDSARAVNAIRGALGTLAELEDLGIVDSTTGEIVHSKIGYGTGEGEGEGGGKGAGTDPNVVLLQRELQTLKNRSEGLERDMGGLIAVMTRRDLKASFPELDEEMLDYCMNQAKFNSDYTPTQYARALVEKLKGRDQSVIDAHMLELEQQKKDELTRKKGADASELFGEEEVAFSYRPQDHEGTKVLSPGQAAAAWLESQEE